MRPIRTMAGPILTHSRPEIDLVVRHSQSNFVERVSLRCTTFVAFQSCYFSQHQQLLTVRSEARTAHDGILDDNFRVRPSASSAGLVSCRHHRRCDLQPLLSEKRWAADNQRISVSSSIVARAVLDAADVVHHHLRYPFCPDGLRWLLRRLATRTIAWSRLGPGIGPHQGTGSIPATTR